jgi:hypothetical protein
MPITVPGASSIASGGTNNYVMTAVDTNSIQGEANLTFDGNDLTLANDVGIIFGNAGEKIEGDGSDLTITGDLVTMNLTDASSKWLKIYKSASGATASSTSTLVLERDGNNYISLLTPNDAYASIFFGDPDDATIGGIQYNHGSGSDILSIYYGGRELRLNKATNQIQMFGTAGSGEDASFAWRGEAADYHIGLDDSSDLLVIGNGLVLGTDAAISINAAEHIGIGTVPGSNPYLEFSPTYTSASGNSEMVRFLGTMTAGTADNNMTGVYIAPTFVKYGSGTHPHAVSMDVHAPSISGSASITTAALIRLRTDASGGSNNYQIWDSTNSAFLSTAGVWTDSSHGDVKIHSPADLDIMPELLAQLNLKQYHRRSPLYDSDGKVMENEDGSTIWTDTVHSDDSFLRYGPLAEEVPEFLATADRKGIGAGYTSGFLIGVAQNHDARIEALEKALGV